MECKEYRFACIKERFRHYAVPYCYISFLNSPFGSDGCDRPVYQTDPAFKFTIVPEIYESSVDTLFLLRDYQIPNRCVLTRPVRREDPVVGNLQSAFRL